MPDPDPKTPDPKTPDPVAPDLAKENAELKARLAALEAKPKDDPDLLERAQRDRADRDLAAGKTKRLESSIEFNMRSQDFLKQNATLLPKDVEDVFSNADKENFADATEKADSIKAALIKSFFNVQENVDLLTPGQKAQLDDFRKLTKTGQQDKAQSLFDMVFEPAFARLKDMKKAAALSGGLHTPSGIEEARKNKLIERSEKYHFRGKKA